MRHTHDDFDPDRSHALLRALPHPARQETTHAFRRQPVDPAAGLRFIRLFSPGLDDLACRWVNLNEAHITRCTKVRRKLELLRKR